MAKSNFDHVTAWVVPSPPVLIVAFARHIPQYLDSADLLCKRLLIRVFHLCDAWEVDKGLLLARNLRIEGNVDEGKGGSLSRYDERTEERAASELPVFERLWSIGTVLSLRQKFLRSAVVNYLCKFTPK